MILHLKFAGALKGANMVIKGVPFRNGVCKVQIDNDEHGVALQRHLAGWQALPPAEADELQAKLDKEAAEEGDIEKAKARAAKAEQESIELRAKVLMLEQAEKESADGEVQDSEASSERGGESTEDSKAPKSKSSKGNK
jgi:hypothetical protein